MMRVDSKSRSAQYEEMPHREEGTAKTQAMQLSLLMNFLEDFSTGWFFVRYRAGFEADQID
jgi:hypothetical protein